MILYNVTVNVEDTILPEWITYMQEEHIPEVIATGCFKGYRFWQIIPEKVETTGRTYCVQYECESLTVYDSYQKKYAPALQAKHTAKYEGHFVAFRTVLKEL